MSTKTLSEPSCATCRHRRLEVRSMFDRCVHPRVLAWMASARAEMGLTTSTLPLAFLEREIGVVCGPERKCHEPGPAQGFVLTRWWRRLTGGL